MCVTFQETRKTLQNNVINIEDVENLRDDIEEQEQTVHEVNNLLAQPIQNIFDEAELEDELSELENEKAPTTPIPILNTIKPKIENFV